MRLNKAGCLILFFGAMSSPLHGQETIAADRPGIGSGSFVLRSGTIQIETGAQFGAGGGTDVYSVGQALVRIGASGLEVQILGPSFVVTRADLTPGADDEGFQDMGFGVKIPIARDVGGRMNVSLQGLVTTPTGSAGFTSDEWVPALNVLADIGMNDRAGVAVNLGYQGGPGAVADVVSVIVTPAVSFGGGVGAYAGWAGAFSDGGDAHFSEAGLTYLPSADVQLDLNGGWDVERDDWFLGGGVAVRWGAR